MKLKRVLAAAASLAVFLAVCPKARGVDYIDKYRRYTEEGKSVSVTEFLTGERDDGGEEYDDRIADFYDSIPDGLKEKIGDFAGDAARGVSKFDAAYFTDLILDSIKDAFSRHFAPLALFAALAVISFVVKTITSGAENAGASENVIRAAVCLCAAASGAISFSDVSSFLKTLAATADASVPAFITLLISGGRAASSGVAATFISALCALTEKVYSSALLPLLAASTALIYAESLFRGVRPSMSAFIKKAAVSVAVSVATVSSFIFGIQSFLANAADTVGAKTVKFALGAAVPYVGGALGDSVSAISAGVSSVKSVFGVTLLVAIFALLLAPLASLAVGKLTLSAAGALCGVLGLAGEEKLFSDLSGIASALIAVCFAASASFAVVISVIISYGAVV